jgi:predicted ArsR family transcriptional regulator
MAPSTPTVPSNRPESGIASMCEPVPTPSRLLSRPSQRAKRLPIGSSRTANPALALRYLAETGGDDAVLEFARRRVAFIERDYATVTSARPELSPAEALAAVLSSEGYAASVRQLPLVNEQSVGEQLCQQHCPVAHVAHEFPQLCEAETEAIGKVLGTHVQRLATIAHGDGVCTTCIPTPDRKAPQ